MLIKFLQALLCFSILIIPNNSQEPQNSETEEGNNQPVEEIHPSEEHQNIETENQAEEDNKPTEEVQNIHQLEENNLNGEQIWNGEHNLNGEHILNGEQNLNGELILNGELNSNGEHNLNGDFHLIREHHPEHDLNGDHHLNAQHILKLKHHLNGEQPFCTHIASPVYHTNIYRGNFDFLNHNYKLAVAFVNSSVIPFVRPGSEKSECESTSPLGCTGYCWQDRVNPKHLYEMLNHHCFYLDLDIGDVEPVRALFKVIHHPDLQFIGHQIMYIVPRQYLVFDKYSDLWDVCNSVSVGQMGEFADAVIVKSFNLTQILHHMKKRYNRG